MVRTCDLVQTQTAIQILSRSFHHCIFLAISICGRCPHMPWRCLDEAELGAVCNQQIADYGSSSFCPWPKRKQKKPNNSASLFCPDFQEFLSMFPCICMASESDQRPLESKVSRQHSIQLQDGGIDSQDTGWNLHFALKRSQLMHQMHQMQEAFCIILHLFASGD